MGRLLDHAHKQAEGVPLRLPDIEGQEVTVQSVEFNAGTYGPYMVMQVIVEGGEVVEVMTGAKLILDAIENAVEADALPCEAKFFRRGNAWLIE